MKIIKTNISEKMKKGIIGFLLLSLPLSFQSCTDLLDYALQILSQTGWLQEKEQMNNIPEDITPFDNKDSQQLKPSVTLEKNFPPIGDQGSYGTCVVWSVGYNLKTALNAIEKGWTPEQLADKSYQTSPKDLWFAIPSDSKSAQCNGTNFEPAMDALIATGAANLSAAPYSGLGSCTGSAAGNSQNKLANYRKIAAKQDGLSLAEQGLTVENFKGYLNAGRPIAIGAQLGDRFMKWNSSAVISSDTYSNPGMQHAYHAMTLVGYDDNKNAFRVRNSWGTSWGDNGSIWVDYNFFCESFCFAAFVAQNVSSVSASNGTIESKLSEGYDLLAYSAEDIADPQGEWGPLSRVFTYDVYNSGDITITPSQKWTVVYMYYNAVNANDYDIIFEDYYTDEFGAGDDYWAGASGLVGGWWNNYSVESGKKAGEAQYPNGFEISYPMPPITGKYYLVVMADAYNVIPEVNEDNNFYFITAGNGKPLEFLNGYIQTNITPASTYAKSSAKQPARYSNTENQTPVKPGNLNAYTPQELKAMLLHDKKSGRLQAKMKAFQNNSNHKEIKRARR